MFDPNEPSVSDLPSSIAMSSQHLLLVRAGFNPTNTHHKRLFQAIENMRFYEAYIVVNGFVFLKNNGWDCEEHRVLYEKFISAGPIYITNFCNLFAKLKQKNFLFLPHSSPYLFFADPFSDARLKNRLLKKNGFSDGLSLSDVPSSIPKSSQNLSLMPAKFNPTNTDHGKLIVNISNIRRCPSLEEDSLSDVPSSIAMSSQHLLLVRAGFNPTNTHHKILFQAVQNMHFLNASEMVNGFVFLKNNGWDCEEHRVLYEKFISAGPIYITSLCRRFTELKMNDFLFPQHSSLYFSLFADPFSAASNKINGFLSLKKIGFSVDTHLKIYDHFINNGNFLEPFLTLKQGGFSYENHQVLYDSLLHDPMNAKKISDVFIFLKANHICLKIVTDLLFRLMQQVPTDLIKLNKFFQILLNHSDSLQRSCTNLEKAGFLYDQEPWLFTTLFDTLNNGEVSTAFNIETLSNAFIRCHRECFPYNEEHHMLYHTLASSPERTNHVVNAFLKLKQAELSYIDHPILYKACLKFPESLPIEPIIEAFLHLIKQGWIDNEENSNIYHGVACHADYIPNFLALLTFLKEDNYSNVQNKNIFDSMFKYPASCESILGLLVELKNAGFSNSQHAIFFKELLSFLWDPVFLKQRKIVAGLFIRLVNEGFPYEISIKYLRNLIGAGNSCEKKLSEILQLKNSCVDYSQNPFLYNALCNNIFNSNNLVDGFKILLAQKMTEITHHDMYRALIRHPGSAKILADFFIKLTDAGWSYGNHPTLYGNFLKSALPFNFIYAAENASMLKVIAEASEPHSILPIQLLIWCPKMTYQYVEKIISIMIKFPALQPILFDYTSKKSSEVEHLLLIIDALHYHSVPLDDSYRLAYQAAIMHPKSLYELMTLGFNMQNSQDCPLLVHILETLCAKDNNPESIQDIVLHQAIEAFEHQKKSGLAPTFDPSDLDSTVISTLKLIPSAHLNMRVLYDTIHLAFWSTFSHHGPINKNPATRFLEDLIHKNDITKADFFVSGGECHIKIQGKEFNLTALCRQANLPDLDISTSCMETFNQILKILITDKTFSGDHTADYLPPAIKNAIYLFTKNEYYRDVRHLFLGTLQPKISKLDIIFLIGILTAKGASVLTSLAHEKHIFPIEKALISRLSRTPYAIDTGPSETEYYQRVSAAHQKKIINQQELQRLRNYSVLCHLTNRVHFARVEEHDHEAPVDRTGIEHLLSVQSVSLYPKPNAFFSNKQFNTSLTVKTRGLPTISSISYAPSELESLVPPTQMITVSTPTSDHLISTVINTPDLEDGFGYFAYEAFIYCCRLLKIDPDATTVVPKILEAIPFVIHYLAEQEKNCSLTTYCRGVSKSGFEMALRVTAAFLFMSKTLPNSSDTPSKFGADDFLTFVNIHKECIPFSCGFLKLSKTPTPEILSGLHYSHYIFVTGAGWFYFNKTSLSLFPIFPRTNLFPEDQDDVWKISDVELTEIAKKFPINEAPHLHDQNEFIHALYQLITTFDDQPSPFNVDTPIQHLKEILIIAEMLYQPSHHAVEQIEPSDLRQIKKQLSIRNCQSFMKKKSSINNRHRVAETELTRILLALEQSQPFPATDAINRNIQELVTICNRQFYNQSFYGNAALNRMMLLEEKISQLLTPEVIAVLFTNNSDQKIYRNTGGLVYLREALFYGLNDGLSIIKCMPNNQKDYGLTQYNLQKTQFGNTLNIARNIESAAELCHIKIENPVVTSVEPDLKELFERIVKSIARLKRSGFNTKLLAVPGYKTIEMYNQVHSGFKLLCEKLDLTLSSTNIPNATLDELCEKFLRSEEVMLHGDISHFFYDRAHLEAALAQHNYFITIGTRLYRYEDIIRTMVYKLYENPQDYPPCASEQFFIRLSLVNKHIQTIENLCSEKLFKEEASFEQPLASFVLHS